LIEQAVIKANRVPTGNLGQTAAPADIYRTKDGWVLCQVTGHPLFIRWAKTWYLRPASGRPGLLLGIATVPNKHLARYCDRLCGIIERFK